MERGVFYFLKMEEMMKKLLHVSVTFLLACFLIQILFVACAPSAKQAAPAEKPGFPLEILDQAGRLVRIDKIPEKVISLSPGNTEIMYALGLQDSLVGVTEYCDFPEAAKQKPQVGGFSTVDIERVVEIQPDLILAASIHEDEITPELERLGLTVITLDPKTIAGVMEAITIIGKSIDRADMASQLVTGMESRIKAITDKTEALPESQKPAVLYILWHDPMMTVGPTTRIHELIEKAGGISIARSLEGEYPKMSLEAIIMADPEVIIAGGGHGSGKNLPFEFAIHEARLEETAARRDNRVYTIDGDLTSRPGPRIVDGLEELANIIHPEIFKSN